MRHRSEPHDNGYELCFRSLYQVGRALAFPCNSEGRVDVTRLTPTARENLAHAWARVGIEFEAPQVVPAPA